jgi:hypothetical protein
MTIVAVAQKFPDCSGCLFYPLPSCFATIRLVKEKYELPDCNLGYIYKESRSQDMRVVHEQLYS